MFFDISSLATYLLAQKVQANSWPQTNTSKSGKISFEDFLASLSGKANSQKQGADSAMFAQAFPFLPATQVVSESSNICEAMPLNSIQEKLNSNLKQFALADYVQQTNQVYPVEPIEAFEASLMPANELKGMVKSQAIPVALSLNQSQASTYSDLNLLNNLNQIDLASLNFLGDTMAGPATVIPADTSANLNPEPAGQGNSVDLSSYTKLSFTIDQLVSQEQKYLDITVFDQNNNLIKLQAPVEQLKQIVRNYPENIIVQVKPNDNSKHIDMVVDSIQMADKTEKYILFDLKSLIAAEDFEKIKIVQKSVSDSRHSDNARSQSSDIDLLNNIKFSKGHGINIKSNSVLFDRITEFDKTLNQSSIDLKEILSYNHKDQTSSRTDYNNTKANANSASKTDQTVSAGYDYSNIKAEEVIQTQKGVGNLSNQSTNEINSSQQLNLKTAAPQIDFKSQELSSGKNIAGDSMDIVEKIIGQIKSKFAITPGYTRMTINLKPESLGKIRLEFEYEGDKIKALLQVDNLRVKSVLDADLPRLKNELKIDSIKVEIALNDFKQNSNTPNQRSHFAKHENYPPHGHSEFDKRDETGTKINSELVKSAKVNVYNGGIINLLA